MTLTDKFQVSLKDLVLIGGTVAAITLFVREGDTNSAATLSSINETTKTKLIEIDFKINRLLYQIESLQTESITRSSFRVWIAEARLAESLNKLPSFDQ